MAEDTPPSKRPPVKMGLRVVARHTAGRQGGRALAREVASARAPKHLAASTRLARHFRVAVDTGNGVAGLYSPPLLEHLGCQVERIHTELDNTYPNHLPDPQMPENVVCLQKKVVETKAHVGLAFDGDGDRLGVIDELGERHEADFVLMLLARAMLKEKPGAKRFDPAVGCRDSSEADDEAWNFLASAARMRWLPPCFVCRRSVQYCHSSASRYFGDRNAAKWKGYSASR